MRLSPENISQIKQHTRDIFGSEARVWLFGSRLDDNRLGGDVDLLVESQHPPDSPALACARLVNKSSRSMHGRKVDVILAAPGLLDLPIHRIARNEGVML
jgi:predicted nucleotidyltransferase